MRSWSVGLFTALLSLAGPDAATASGVAVPEVGAETAPPTIPVEAFTAPAGLADAELSATGAAFAYLRVEDGKAILKVHSSDDLRALSAVDLGSADDVNWFRWAGDDTLLVSVMLEQENNRYHARFSRLMAFDVPRQTLRYVGLKQGIVGDDVIHVDRAGRYFLLSVRRDQTASPEVWRVSLDQGEGAEPERVQEKTRGVDRWWADNAGVVRLGMRFSEYGSARIWYRSGPGEPFRRITRVSAGSDAWSYWREPSFRAGSDLGYVMASGDGGRRVLREIDYRTGELGRVVYEHAEWDLDRAVYDASGRLLGVVYTDDEPRTHWFDGELRALQQRLQQVLPGSNVRMIDLAGTDRMLVRQSGPADPGGLYVFTPGEGRLDLVGNIRPQIDIRHLAPSSAHSFTARDGTEIRAYLTLPRGSGRERLPLIVMPHGGPFGVRDALVYSDWVQLLANRGYAVLQPNFRGSSGRGEAFEALGAGQIGGAMQDDLDDAMDWAVEAGFADPARVCLVGASYGGYAALWGVIRNPERYRCAASYSGVTDWEDMLRHDRRFLHRSTYSQWRERVRGEEDFDEDAISPARQVRRLSRPVFLAQGRHDKVVPLRQFTLMVDAAKDAGVALETLVLDDTHHLEDPENEAEFLSALLDFLHRHNPAD